MTVIPRPPASLRATKTLAPAFLLGAALLSPHSHGASLASGDTGDYTAVINFDRADYYVQDRHPVGSSGMDRIQSLQTAIVFKGDPDGAGNLVLPTGFDANLAYMNGGLQPGTRVTLSLGSLNNLVGNAPALNNFINQLDATISSRGITGIDIDWEDTPLNGTPGAPTDAQYAAVVKAISDRFRPKEIVLSISNSRWEGAYKARNAAVAPYVDYLNLQFYYSTDNAMSLATMATGLANFVNAGIPASKIRVGLPVYGTNNGETIDIGYAGLVANGVDVRHQNQWTNPSTGVTYYFSSLDLLKAKVDYAKANGFAGVFTWEITTDTDYTNPLSALRTIDTAALGAPATLELNDANYDASQKLGTGKVNLGSGAVLDNGLLRFKRSGSNTYANRIDGFGRVETALGTTILTGANTYSGGTTIISGSTLQIGAGGASGSLGTGAVVNDGSLVINRSDAFTLANTISGSGTLDQNGAGVTTLSGANTYTGATRVNAGTLDLAGTITSDISVASGATLSGTGSTTGSLTLADGSRLVAGNGVLTAQGGVFTNRTTTGVLVSLAAGATPPGTRTVDIVAYGAGDDPGVANFTLDGYRGSLADDTARRRITATVTTYANTWQGGVSGNWNLGVSSVWANGADSKFYNGDAVAFGAIAADTAVIIAGRLAPSSVTVANAANTLTWSGAGTIAGDTTLVKNGAGALVINTANNFTGTVSVNAGTVKLGNFNALGATDFTSGRIGVASGGTIDLNGVAAGYGYTIAGAGATGTGALINTGSAIGTGLMQTGDITLSADATVGGAGDFAMVAPGHSRTTLDLAGHTLTKSGSNTFSFANTILTSGTVNIGAGVISQTFAGTDGSAAAFTLGNNAGAALTLNNLNLSAGSLSGGGATGGRVNLGTATLTVGALNTATNYAGILNGDGGVVKTGTGSLTLTGANTYTGTTVVNAGTLALGAGGSLYATGGFFGTQSATYVFVGGGGTLETRDWNYGAGNALNELRNNAYSVAVDGGTVRFTQNSSGHRAFTVGGQGATLEAAAGTTYTKLAGTSANENIIAGAGAGNLTLGGAGNGLIADALGAAGTWMPSAKIVKTGAGTWTLSGANTLAGGVTVEAGTLVTGNAGALGTGGVAVTGGTLVLGDGTANTVALGAGASLAIGAGGTLKLAATSSAVTLSGSGGYNFAGTLDLAGLFDGVTGTKTYTLIVGGTGAKTDALAAITGFDASRVSASFGSGVLTVAAVPEPSAFGLAGAGALVAALAARRRRSGR